MKLTLSVLTFFTLLLITNAKLEATAYLVSNLQEFNDARAVVVPGDSIVLKKGTWTDIRFYFIANGAPGNPITLTVEEYGTTVIKGNSNLRIYGDYLVVDGLYFTEGQSPGGGVIEFRNSSSQLSHHSRLTNSAVVEFNPQNIETDYKWVSIYGSNNRVDHCYFAGKNHRAALLVVWMDSQPDSHMIDHNYFGYRPDFGDNGAETIRIGTSDWSMYNSNCIVEYNYFEECDGEIEIISNKSCENIYRYNTFYKSAGTLTLRHGNRCDVYGNYFFGANKESTGGVRIIGEDHKVWDNYFVDLTGSGYWSALSMVNGVPNSPLNRYFQVKNALVAFNTFVNNTSNFDIGTGKSSEQSLPPLDCVIANNHVLTQSSPITTYTDEPINMFYEGNIMFGGDLGIPLPQGITMVDPQLVFAPDTVWRITSLSPGKDNSSGSYDVITDDFDGQLRDTTKDIGCDELSSEPVTRIRADGSNTGPSFLEFILLGGNIKKVGAGTDSLYNAIQNASDFDIFELITNGGTYENTNQITITKKIQIRGAAELEISPIISNINPNPNESVFEIMSDGNLYISKLEIDGGSGSSNPKNAIISTQQLTLESFYLIAEECYFRNVNGSFYYAAPFSIADSIVFRNCLFTGSADAGIKMDNEDVNSGRYNTKKLIVENSTFWKLNKEAVSVYGGDSLANTQGPIITINHCTFDSIGMAGSPILELEQVHDAEVINSIFSNSNYYHQSISLYGNNSEISYSDTFKVGSINLVDGATASVQVLGEDPLYQPGPSGYYMLSLNSPLLGMASDWRAMGDLRWDPTLTDIEEGSAPNIPLTFELKQNYPNPFNPTTTIGFQLNSSGETSLKIYDIKGSLIKIVSEGFFSAGYHEVVFKAKGLPSGIYFYQLQQGINRSVKKMILLK